MGSPIPSHVNGSPPRHLLHVDTIWRDAWALVAVRGELDIATAPCLSAHLQPLLASEHGTSIALDLSALAFCDSSGLNLLLRASRQAMSTGGRLVILRPTRHLLRLFQLTGLMRRIEVADDLPAG